jgi:class I fructose-bisphosphate aldolase
MAMDQGVEHGPKDFNEDNIDPDFVYRIAEKTPISAFAIHKGIALKYFDPYCTKVPLLLKINGKTNIAEETEPYSAPTGTVKDAVAMGAEAVGFTLYVGSPLEAKLFKDLTRVESDCREYGMPLVVWSYPRGPAVAGKKTTTPYVAYAARVALELGADITKVYYTGSKESFIPVVQAGGKMPVLVAGGIKRAESDFFSDVHDLMSAGAKGMAVGRNIWQHKTPIKMAKAITAIIYDGKSANEAHKILKGN